MAAGPYLTPLLAHGSNLAGKGISTIGTALSSFDGLVSLYVPIGPTLAWCGSYNYMWLRLYPPAETSAVTA